MTLYTCQHLDSHLFYILIYIPSQQSHEHSFFAQFIYYNSKHGYFSDFYQFNEGQANYRQDSCIDLPFTYIICLIYMIKEQNNQEGDQGNETKQKEWDHHQNIYFYDKLHKYEPLFNDTTAYPRFLKNKQSSGTFAYMVVFNSFELLLSYYINILIQEKMYSQFILSMSLILNLLLLFTVDLSYFLILYMNPGVKYLRQITQKEYEMEGKQFCVYCDQYKTSQFTHCQLCKVCIYKKDHHCSVFERCVGANQRFAFFVFLFAVAFIFATNMLFIMTMLFSS